MIDPTRCARCRAKIPWSTFVLDLCAVAITVGAIVFYAFILVDYGRSRDRLRQYNCDTASSPESMETVR